MRSLLKIDKENLKVNLATDVFLIGKVGKKIERFYYAVKTPPDKTLLILLGFHKLSLAYPADFYKLCYLPKGEYDLIDFPTIF